jgi:hypothetical protein
MAVVSRRRRAALGAPPDVCNEAFVTKAPFTGVWGASPCSIGESRRAGSIGESRSEGGALSPSPPREPTCCVGVPLSRVRERPLLPIFGPRRAPAELLSATSGGGSGGGFATAIESPTRDMPRPPGCKGHPRAQRNAILPRTQPTQPPAVLLSCEPPVPVNYAGLDRFFAPWVRSSW